MNKIAVIFSIACFTVPAVADDEISVLFSELQNNAKICDELPSQINKIKLSAGIGIGTGAIGTIGGTTAVVTGMMKSKQDKKASDIRALLAMNEDDFEKAVDQGKVTEVFKNLTNQNDTENNKAALSKEKQEINEKSQKLGNIRTISSGVAGVANTGGAIVSFMSAKDFDKIISDMDECEMVVEKIDNLKSRAEVETPDDTSTIEKMQTIVDSCKGLNSGNIKDIKNKMFAAGVASSIGGVTGITGAILSASAVKKEKGDASIATKSKAEGGTKGLNTASNILAAGTAVASATGAVLSGVTLVGLNKNSDIAGKCADALDK